MVIHEIILRSLVMATYRIIGMNTIKGRSGIGVLYSTIRRKSIKDGEMDYHELKDCGDERTCNGIKKRGILVVKNYRLKKTCTMRKGRTRWIIVRNRAPGFNRSMLRTLVIGS